MLKIKVGDFKLGLAEEKVIRQVLKSGRLSEGPKVKKFEEQWAKYIGTTYCVSVNSGTSALIAGLCALKSLYRLKDGAKVITSPLTFIATVNAIVAAGFEPVFADINRKTFVIEPDEIQRCMKEHKDVAVILPVHLMGYAADMKSINALAHGLLVMEDAAQAHGTKHTGVSSQMACYSFYIAHNIQAGEMGAVVTNNLALCRLLRKIKAHGRMCECPVCVRAQGKCPQLKSYKGKDDFDPRFYHDTFGYNFKTMEFQAALGLLQLKKADRIFKKRSDNVCYLNDKLAPFKGILQLPVYSQEVSYLAYPLVIRDPKKISRKELRQRLEAAGIETRPLFGCIPTQQPAYAYLKRSYSGKLPNAEYVGAYGFYIGCHQYLTRKDLDFIIKTFHRILT